MRCMRSPADKLCLAIFLRNARRKQRVLMEKTQSNRNPEHCQPQSEDVKGMPNTAGLDGADGFIT
jgi:hypothetical protein